MPLYQGKKVGVMVYMTPETFAAIEKMRGNYISASAQCAMILEEVLSYEEENCKSSVIPQDSF